MFTPTRVAGVVAWFAVLVLLFMLATGEGGEANWVGALATGAVGAGIAAALMAKGLLSFRLRGRWCRELPSVAGQIFVDFWILTRQLAVCVGRRSRAQGRFIAKDYDAGGHTAQDVTWRAFAAVVATWSPNSYVVDIDPDAQRSLVHDLVPNPDSESPA